MHNETNTPGNMAIFRRIITASVLLATTLLAACTSVYVDTQTKQVPVAQMKKVADPKPVQLVFEFQTKGAPNARATDTLSSAVSKEVKDSGLFSTVSSNPQPNAGMLSVTLNNVPITEDAASKGFVTGLTFGLAGNTVTDGYICTVSYLAPNRTTPIVKTARHAIHTTIGNASAPANAQKSPSALDAINQMTLDVLSNALDDLSRDPAFE